MASLKELEGLAGTSRTWRGPWWKFFGTCDAEDSVSCCLAWSAPAVGFAWNSHRALGRAFWHEFLKLVAFGAAIFLIYYPVTVYTSSVCTLKEKTPACTKALNVQSIAFLIILPLCLLLIVGRAIFASRRRAAIRKKFGIQKQPGECGDFCLWCCCSCCALAQETRTILHNNVQHGMWKGPESSFMVAPVVATAV